MPPPFAFRPLGRAALAAIALAATPATAEPPAFLDLETVYVVDPGAPWFEHWYRAAAEAGGPFFAPRIRPASPGDIAARLAAEPRAVALLTGAQRAALPEGTSLSEFGSGERVCAAVLAKQGFEQLGDLHVGSEPIRIAVAADTFGLAEALVALHDAADRVRMVEVPAGDGLAALDDGLADLAVLPIADGGHLRRPFAWSPSAVPVSLSAAVMVETERQGFVRGRYSTSLAERIGLAADRATWCDEVRIVANGAFGPARLRPAPPAASPETAATGLLGRSTAALGELWSLICPSCAAPS